MTSQERRDPGTEVSGFGGKAKTLYANTCPLLHLSCFSQKPQHVGDKLKIYLAQGLRFVFLWDLRDTPCLTSCMAHRNDYKDTDFLTCHLFVF